MPLAKKTISQATLQQVILKRAEIEKAERELAGLEADVERKLNSKATVEPGVLTASQMRHADVKTTLRVYSHVIPQTQRDAMEQVGRFHQSLPNRESLLAFARK